MRVVPDTSIWIEFFRRGSDQSADELDRLLREDSVLLCGPILAELLAGAPDEHRTELWLALGSLPWIDLDHAGWREAGELAHALRRRGHSVPLLDLIIAVACARAEAVLWTRDRDFERVTEVLPGLELYSEA